MTVAFFGQLEKKMVEMAGGKGASLNDMVAAGFPVPEGYVVCADTFRELIKEKKLFPKISALLEKTDLDSPSGLENCSGQIKQMIMEAEMPAVLREEIIKAYKLLCREAGVLPVAVRSSSTAEDLDDASFAGQQETFLYVIGEDELIRKVKGCWASLYNSRAIFYRRGKGFSEENVSIAVVVQRMIDSEKAGVMFTVNPITKQKDSVVIEAVWGLGEGAVSGLVTPDSYVVRKNSFEMEMEYISTKEIMIVRSDSKGGVQEKTVPPDLENAKVLTGEEIRTLVEYGQKLEDYFGKPQDVEWAVEDGKVYLLQSRPVTTL
ncbi:MAG TPA: PEP/pyruvate-binding domain-containing protein [Bacillota bacterium]|nr:PEP/pyruvate-binding domain-containing protein [Bacillota bacterium]